MIFPSSRSRKSKNKDLTLWPFRRTAATGMAEMGIPGDILDRVQNHISRQKQGGGHIYNRYSYDKEKQQALEAWERRLKSIMIGGDSAKVLPMIRKSG